MVTPSVKSELVYVDVDHLSTVVSGLELKRKYLSVDYADMFDVKGLTLHLRRSKPSSVRVVTGPEGIKHWLGLPTWVTLWVWPDNYEVHERVSPLVQELIWAGIDKVKAKQWEKKPPKKLGYDIYLLSYNTSMQWPELYDGGVERIEELLPYGEYIALDFETDAQYKFRAITTGLAAASNGQSVFAGYYRYDGGVDVQRRGWESAISSSTPVFHNAAFDIGVAKGKGWTVPTVFEDTMLAAFSAGEKWREDRGLIGLKHLAKKYLGWDMKELSDLVPDGQMKKYGTLNVDPQALAQYAKEDARATLELLPILKDKAPENIYQLEKDLVPVVLEIEEAGFPLAQGPLLSIIDSANEGMGNIQNWLTEACGWSGNMNSPAQVSTLVYDQLGLKGSYGRSVGKEAMAELSWHPVCKRIRAWNKLESLHNEAMALNMQYIECGYAYTNFNQTGASTGRFSSSSPINLQNKTNTLRKAFVARDKGEVVYRADYAQIELRIPAAWSGDKNMLAAITSGESLHKNLHKMILERGIRISYAQVKTFDFALFYGADVPRVMEVVHCTQEQAEDIISAVESSWEEAMAWRATQIQLAKDNLGWNYSMCGRPFWHPDLFSTDFKAYSHATRTAVNKPIQGTAADIMKQALLGVPELHRKYGGKARLTVHDEIAGTIPLENWELFKRDLRAVMLEAEPRVPLEVEIGYGKNWKEAKP